MPFVGTAVAVTVLGLAAGSFAAVAVAALVNVAISAALSFAANALFAQEEPEQAAVNSPESKGNVKQAIPAQRLVVGETRIGGAFFFYEKKPPYLYIGLLHSILPITNYKRLYIGEIEVPLDGNGQPNSLPYFTGGSSKLTVATQDGLRVDQPVNPIIAADFPELGEHFRLPATANTVLKFDFGVDFEEHQELWGNGQIPNAEWVVDATPVPDARKPTNILPADFNDPAQLEAALATWKFTRNAAQIQAMMAMIPAGFNAGGANMAWEEIIPAIDFDDENVPLKDGGTQKRHTIDGVVLLNQNPLVVMERMLTANGGFVSTTRGRVLVASSQPIEIVATITDNDLIGGYTFRSDQPKRDLANIVNMKFISPEANHQVIEGPVTIRQDLVDVDGERLPIDVRLPFTTTHQRGQRRVKAELEDTRLGRTLNPACTMRLYGVKEGQGVRVDSEIFPDMNGIYQVRDWSKIGSNDGVQFSLSEYDPKISRNWNAQNDEQDFEVEAA